ncbi:MAG: hypothetical protein ABIO77_02780 [Ginsengibacter sp.]
MKLQIVRIAIAFLLFTSACTNTSDNPVSSDAPLEEKVSYRVENTPLPPGLYAETGALAFLPDGRLVACFLRGEVMLYNPATKEWSLFAEGLHEPLGILVISNSEFLVMQRPELTRIKDTDGDGHADLYEKVTNDFGMSGNYHEWNYGPVKDEEGNLFIALSTASNAGTIMKEVRGKLDTSTLVDKQEKYSAVPYRGWILKLTPGGILEPYASGFRSPNGLGFDLERNLFCIDNQGGWVGTNGIYHVEKGKFYGHPSSLPWTKNWSGGDPFKIPVDELNKMRTKASVLFPYEIIGNSLTQPLCDNTDGKFGPFSGQMLLGEMEKGRIVRVMMENVGGALQGACIPLFDSKDLRQGNNRLAFAPDGSLWVGHVQYGFPGDLGIQRIVYTGKTPMDIYSMNLTPTGFDLTFTKPVDKTSAMQIDNYNFRSYYYEYHWQYGSDLFDVQPIPVTNVQVSPDRKKVSLTLAALKSDRIYELNLGEIKSVSGDSLANKIICYTINKLKK